MNRPLRRSLPPFAVRAAGAALLVLLLAPGIPAATAAVPPGPLIGGHPGTWTVADLAGSLPPMTGRSGSRTLAYSLPRGTVQGRPLWYLVRLDAAVDLPAADGSYLLSVDTDGYTCLQVEYAVRGGVTTTDSLDLVAGRRLSRTTGPASSVHLQNYLQLHGVQPGRNTWTVTWETLSGPGARSVTVSPGSGVSATAVRPDELGLQVVRSPVTVVLGRDADLPFRLVRRGGRPDRPVTVQLQHAGGGLPATGASSRRLPGIGSGSSGAFRVHAAAIGRYTVGIRVDNAYNSPAALVTVVVQPPVRRQVDPRRAAVAAAALLCGAGGLGLTRYRRRRRQ